MARALFIAILVIGVAALIGLRLSAYTVDEVNYGVVLQFGEIVKVRRSPGLYFKAPIIHEVTYLDKRVLTSDTPPEEYLTLDQKRIVVDQITRWRITDPRSFFLALNTEIGGRAALERLVLGSLRELVANRPYDVMISQERDVIMELVREAVNARVVQARWGMQVVDVRAKRADLPVAVERTVYERMASARKVEADRHRAQGQLRSDQITSQTDREVQIMLACADRVSKETRGDGEAAAITIFAESLKQDPEFFSFLRRLEAYDASFGPNDRLVMSTDSNFFRLLTGEAVPIPSIEATRGSVVPLSAEILDSLTQDEIDLLIRECTPETVEDIAPN